jgi:hypothetical protein
MVRGLMPHYLWLSSLYARLSPATRMGRLKNCIWWKWKVGCGGDEDWLVDRAHQVVFTR